MEALPSTTPIATRSDFPELVFPAMNRRIVAAEVTKVWLVCFCKRMSLLALAATRFMGSYSECNHNGRCSQFSKTVSCVGIGTDPIRRFAHARDELIMASGAGFLDRFFDRFSGFSRALLNPAN